MEMKSRLLLTCLIAWVLLTCNVLRAADDNEYTDEDQPLVRVMNEAGAPLHVYWIDPENGDEVLLSSKAIAAGQSMTLNSFNTHRFVVRYEDTHPSTLAARFTKSASHEVAVVTATAHHMLVELTPLDTPDELAAWRLPSGGSSGSGRSRQTTSAVNEVVAEVGADAEVEEYEYEYVRPRHVAALAPLQRVKHAVGVCEHTKGDRINFSRCMMAAAKDDLEVLVRKKDSTIKSRDRMASRLRNYTCEDDALQTTPPLYSQRFHVIDRDHDVHMLLDEPRAKIWTVNDFISADECDVLKRVGGPHLRRATVADEGGAAVVSENRKAQQARYRGADNEVFTADDPLFPLYQRIFNLTNEVASYRLHTDGQEGFMLIQVRASSSPASLRGSCSLSCDSALCVFPPFFSPPFRSTTRRTSTRRTATGTATTTNSSKAGGSRRACCTAKHPPAAAPPPSPRRTCSSSRPGAWRHFSRTKGPTA
jgi:hypothetical protein